MDAKLRKALASGESETVEFKNSFDKEAMETLAAFANTKGGRVFIGISDVGLPFPEFKETSGGFMVTTYKKTLEVTPQVAAILRAAETAVSASSLQHAAGLRDRVHFLKMYLAPLIECGWLERTIPDKPRSRMQKYRLAAEGEKMLEKLKTGKRI